MQDFSDMKLQCVTIGLKTLVLVVSNKEEARILCKE